MSSNVTGLVSVHFSNSSDLFPGLRDVRLRINDFTASVGSILDTLWAERGVSPALVAQHEVLVFATDGHGTVVFDADRIDELRQRALGRDGVVRNYGQIEVTALKMSEEKQRARDAAAEEEALLRDMEQPALGGAGGGGGLFSAVMFSSSAAAAANGGSKAATQRAATASAASSSATGAATTMTTQQQRQLIKATLCSLTLPLSRKRGADVAEQDNGGKCLLCRSNPIRRDAAEAAKIAASGSRAACDRNSNCRRKTCDECYAYCFSGSMLSQQCPVCGRTSASAAAATATTNTSVPSATTTNAAVAAAAARAAAARQERAAQANEAAEEVETSPVKLAPIVPRPLSSANNTKLAAPSAAAAAMQQLPSRAHVEEEEEDVVVTAASSGVAPVKFRRVE